MDVREYIESGVIEGYVLSIADPEEIAEVERLKEQYPEIQNAIDDFSLTLEETAMKNAVLPPAELKGKIMASLAAEANQTGNPLKVAYSANFGTQENVAVKNMYNWRMVAAASVVLFVASAVTNLYLYNKYTNTNSQYQALLTERNSLQASNEAFQIKLRDYQEASEMLANPAFAMIRMQDPNNKQDYITTAFWNQNTADVYLSVNKLPDAGTGKQYQLWALVDGKPVDAGMIDENCTTLCKMKSIPRAQAFAITLEKTGGSPVPTMDQLYVLGKV